MKKIIVLLFATSLFVTNILAQEKKHEFELGIGIWNFNEIVNTVSSIIVSTVPDMEMVDEKSYGSIHTAYKYRVQKRLGVGALFAFDYATSVGMVRDDIVGEFRKQHYTIAAEGDFIYLNYEKLKIYGLAGLGTTIYNLYYDDMDNPNENDSNSKTYFTFQLTPIGIKYGRRFGGFLELGFGYRGILNVGLFYRI